MKSIQQLYNEFDSRITTFSGITRISTGSVIFDLVLGGGIPRGASLSIASEPGCGKTSLLLSTAKNYIENGYKVIYLDYEKGVSPSMLEGFGLQPYVYNAETNTDGALFMFWPDTFGDGERILDTILPTREVGLCVVDSSTFMVPDTMVTDNEKERVSITSVRPGEQAQLMSKWVEKYLCLGNRYATSIIYVQQMRTKISFVRTTVEASGGYALKHALSASVMMSRDKFLTKSVVLMDGSKQELKIGADVRIWCSKSRISKPYLEGVLSIIFGKGVSNVYTYLRWCKGQTIEVGGREKPIISQGGAGYYTITLPSGEYKTRGDSGLYSSVREHIVEIIELVQSRGGLKLMVSGSEDI